MELLIKSMNDLKVEMSGFRAEMKEFKKTVDKRIDSLDNRTLSCQYNPSVCATARKLDEHIKTDAGKSGKIIGIIGCVMSCVSMGFLILEKLVR